MAYTVFESINMGTTHYDGKIFDAVCASDVENGTFGYITGIDSTNGDPVYTFVKGYAEGKDVFVVDQPAWDSDTSRIANQRRDKFINKAGSIFRIREVKRNDKFGITIDGVTSATQATMDIGKYVTIDSSTGKLVAAAASTGAVFEGIVESKRTSGSTLVTTAHNYGHSAVIYKVRVIACGDNVASGEG